ncbi:RNA annealing protein [Wickerhamomyces ciferrii]|uniref:RNA annealing protein n=1 Tax=Wickerhamomyces ciferrii (strain ATCC 14091 / BCRC 22168 / CBS 111 / JCM 3599 / NBRC 0793 / NRRL Y-1031 F-60-10) TaxID=1206466 RepID=K0KNS2_WICCF|nr:RNA annealing protein [Wickerhamomyces ciferrii]CCH43049.1 RNA annealing protein [Wickerhamomyces ciferrii]
MSALDQSLDEILSSKPKRQFNKKKAPVAKARVGKQVGKQAGKPVKKTPTGPAPKRDSSVLDASYANKVVVYHLPRDIKQDAIKDFFASQVGGVASVGLSYNEKGQSKGIATIIFKSAANASKAVEKYNGAPIDGGSQKLKLELIIDPTKRPLSSRIAANVPTTQPKGPKGLKAGSKKGGEKTISTSNKPNQNGAKKQANKPKNKKPAKKTLEELDQEMSDYFEKKD